MDILRALDLKKLLTQKSYFLLGARQTGKSTLIRNQLKGMRKYNLLDRADFQKLSFNPFAIREEMGPQDKIIIIDEIQKLPELLDEVQYLIEEKKINFLLTGSSARKLRKYGTNLLGGRARLIYFHPLTFSELKDKFDLNFILNYGCLPSIYFSEQPEQDLDAYIGLYVQQEVANEGLTRNLPNFARFLEVISLSQAEQLNMSKISSDAQIPRTTLNDYLEILKDTLIANTLPVWGEGKKRKPVATHKFYFFDWGVARKLAGLGKINLGSPLSGKAFESYIYHELQTMTDYRGLAPLSYWRTQTQDEVDFIFNNEVAIEVKASATVSLRDIKSLLKLKEEKKLKRYCLIYTGKARKTFKDAPGIEVIPYQEFLKSL